MDNINILVVEDEKNISDVIVAYLEKENFNVFVANDGIKAIELFNEETIHIIILDLMIPLLSGEEVCKKIRAISNVPIIMLTAKTEEEEKITGLSIGADDYVSKPFSPRELTSRVKALLRRSYRNGIPLAEKLYINNGDLEIEVDKMLVKKSDNKISLTSNEFKILLALVSNADKILSREQLIEASFGYDYEGFDRTIDTHIKNIRSKIEDNPKSPKYIQTVYGVGYRFNPQSS
ncbi:MAG: response regulator transcription factor [Tissierellia bacterium]|nr:response regulator transcription factor [Tissierellia bacterium]